MQTGSVCLASKATSGPDENNAGNADVDCSREREREKKDLSSCACEEFADLVPRFGCNWHFLDGVGGVGWGGGGCTAGGVALLLGGSVPLNCRMWPLALCLFITIVKAPLPIPACITRLF